MDEREWAESWGAIFHDLRVVFSSPPKRELANVPLNEIIFLNSYRSCVEKFALPSLLLTSTHFFVYGFVEMSAW